MRCAPPSSQVYDFRILQFSFYNDCLKYSAKPYFFTFFSVFTQRGLEKNPTLVLPPVEVFHIARSGAIEWESQPSEKKEKFKEVIHKMKQQVKQRRILTKPFFQDFDRWRRFLFVIFLNYTLILVTHPNFSN